MTPPRREPLRPDLERTLVVMIDHHLGNFCLAILNRKLVIMHGV